jgi:hypothetical protein
MKRFSIAALLLLGCTLCFQHANASAATSAPPSAVQPAAAAQAVVPEDPVVTRRAMEWFGRFQNGTIDRTQLSTAIDAKLTPAALAAMKKQLAPLGAPTGIGYGGAREVKGEMVYRYVIVFAVGAIQEFMSVDKLGKISGVLFLPVR